MTENYYAPAARSGPRLMQRAATILPMARYMPRNPMFLGAAALGIMGVLAWRNREKIRRTASPLLQNAAQRTSGLRERMPWSRATGTPAGLQENLH